MRLLFSLIASLAFTCCSAPAFALKTWNIRTDAPVNVRIGGTGFSETSYADFCPSGPCIVPPTTTGRSELLLDFTTWLRPTSNGKVQFYVESPSQFRPFSVQFTQLGQRRTDSGKTYSIVDISTLSGHHSSDNGGYSCDYYFKILNFSIDRYASIDASCLNVPGLPPGEGIKVYQRERGQITEVWIDGSQVPEPSTWIMLISGFTIAGIMMRRRNWTVAPFL